MVFKSNNPGELSKAGFFVTGTDTEVGKTLISGALITHLKNNTLWLPLLNPWLLA